MENPGHRVGKDMYGNRFLSAFYTASYKVESLVDGKGTRFTRDKNCQKNIERRFELIYDPSCYRSWTSSDDPLSKKDRLDNFIKTCQMSNKTFTFEEMQSISDLSDSALRVHLAGYLKKIVLPASILNRGKILYRVKT